MSQRIKLVPIIVTIILFIVFQIGFLCKDTQDTPAKAVKEFAKAYFHVDESLADRLCEERKTANGDNVVETYIYERTKEASDRGYSLFYLREKLYDARTTSTQNQDGSYNVRLTGRVRPPLKSFFTQEGYRDIDETIHVINDQGTWKVCGKLFSLP